MAAAEQSRRIQPQRDANAVVGAAAGAAAAAAVVFLLLLFCLILLCRFVVAAHADVSMPLDTGDGGDYPWHLHQSCQGFLRTPPW